MRPPIGNHPGRTVTLFFVLPAAAALLAAILSHYIISSYVIRHAEERVREVLLFQRGLHHYIQRVIHPTYFTARQAGEIGTDFYSPEILSSTFIVRTLHNYYNEERRDAKLPLIYYKMAAENPRNPLNRADTFETALLRQFNANRSLKEIKRIETENGKEMLVYAIPFLETNKSCLRCHGKRRDAPIGLQVRYPGMGGFGETLGNIRAIEIVKMPIDQELTAVTIGTASAVAGLLTLMTLVMITGRLRGLVAERTATLEQEITEHQAHQQQLSDSEHRYRHLVESVPDIIYVHSTSKGGMFYSGNVRKSFGYTPQQMLAKPYHWHDAIHPADWEIVRKALASAPESGVFDITYRVRHTTGEWRWLHDRSMVVRPEETGCTIEGIASDITDTKLATEALQESEERFRQVAESAGEFIWEVDADGLYLYANSVVEKILGYQPEELVGKRHFYEFFPEDRRDELRAAVMEMFRNKLPFQSFRKHSVRKNGTIVTLEASGQPIIGTTGKLIGYRGTDTDITKRLQLEQQLRQAQKMEAIGQLAGGIAHDFNNILQVISTFGFLIQRQLEECQLPSTFADEVIKAGKRASDLTRGLLAFSRKQVMNPAAVRLNDIVEDARKFLARIIGEDICFTVEHEPGSLPVMADSSQLQQLLINLVANARDAMPEGGTLSIRTGAARIDEEFISRHGFGEPGSYARITVTDTGCGIAEETLKHVFEPFFTTKEMGKGTGLGLSIVYGIVKQHNGYVTVQSVIGSGTSFDIYLPEILPEQQRADEPPVAPVLPGGKEKILLVEDEETVRIALRHILCSHGFSVVEAHDGEKAVEVFRENPAAFQLVLLDVVMPTMSGKETLAALRSYRKEIPVIFISGYAADVLGSRLTLDERTILLSKPVMPAQLLEKIRQMLDHEGKDAHG